MPLYIETGVRKIKKNHINLNNYRNWHYIHSDKLKKIYKDIAIKKIESQPTIKADKIAIEYVLYRGDKRKFDLMNILSIHDKFFMDALVWLECIPDDNIDHLDSVKFKFGGYDKDNPRVAITITTLL